MKMDLEYKIKLKNVEFKDGMIKPIDAEQHIRWAMEDIFMNGSQNISVERIMR
jgi:hypothetical protein